jgi:hypothetical protein
MMKSFGDQLLARAPLTDHEYGTVQRRGTARALDRVEESQALADKLVCPLHYWPTVGGKSHHLARIFTPLSGAKLQFLQLCALFPILARTLYVWKQV